MVQMIRRSLRALSRVLAAMAIVAWAPSPASAQWAEFDESAFEAFSVPLTRASFDRYAALLSLDEDQTELGKALLDGFVEGHRAAVNDIKKIMRDAQEKAREGDFSAYTDMGSSMQGIQGRIETLEKSFFADLKALLTPEQQEKWPRVERMRLREQGLRFGFVSGAGVDVIRLVEGLKIDASSSELREALDRYELDVDRVLQDMKRLEREMQGDQAAGGMPDMEKIGQSMRRMMELGRDIRDVNRTAVRQIEPLLPEEKRAELTKEFQRRAYPRVYRESHADKCLKALAGFSDLTSEQKTRLDDVRAVHARDAAAANERWVTAIDERDNRQDGSFMEISMEIAAEMGQIPGDPDSPVGQARKSRRQVDDATLEKINGILTEDQKKRLPEKSPEPTGIEAMFGPDALGGG